GRVLRRRRTAQDAAGDVLPPLLLAGRQVKRDDLALRLVEPIRGVRDAAGGDDDRVAGERRPAPRVLIERGPPEFFAGGRVQGEGGPIALLLLVQVRGRDDHFVSGHQDRGVHVPAFPALGPDRLRGRLEQFVLVRRDGEVGVLFLVFVVLGLELLPL